MDELFQKSLIEVSGLLAAGEVSPVELAKAQLDRIAALDDGLNAYITLMTAEAMAAAGEAEQALARGERKGPLHGIPIAVKDLLATRGTLTTAGSLLFRDWVPDYDAGSVARLRQAGAVLIGKTNMHELAYGTTSINPHFGAVRNPWSRDCHAGGSSGGSASAVAAGLAFGALGSDTGCSIRQPAHCCGIVGLKPNFGRVSKHGAVTLSWSMDHIGPMTRRVADAAVLLQAIAGFDPNDPYSAERPVPDFSEGLDAGVKGLRIGLVRGFFFEDCEPEVTAAVEAAAALLADLGARVEETELPMMEEAYAAGSVIIIAEASAYHAQDYLERPEVFSEEVRAALAFGHDYSAAQFLQFQRMRRLILQKVEAVAGEYDVLIMPTCPLAATPIDNTPKEHGALRYRNCIPFDLTGHPALSLPCGFTAAGLPIGLQIVGRGFDEAGVLRVGAAYEAATDWHRAVPPDVNSGPA